ncbi:hypothetical protein HNY73_015821 [Argiope bruennichi]|uniref:Uncharacterized protein n=1 Tax=Argiope bruennichi TaxID=94029 RepID=A0A8T0EGX9_ARGBR|nr:hypothetical protein HNY73_015821 [Argiope bruennichi]
MYNFRSKLLILLLVILLIVPAVYCFSLFSLDSEEKVDEGQNGATQTTVTDMTPTTKMNDIATDSSIDDDSASDSTENEDVSTKGSMTGDDDTTKSPAANDDSISWPVIMIVEDHSSLINAKSESDSRRVDSSNKWLVINKRTSIRKVEEDTHDFGKNRKVLNEDKTEELRVYRDNFHTVVKNEIDLTNILRL